MDHIFPEETKQEKINKIIESVLGERKVTVFIGNFVLREKDREKQSHVTCNLVLEDKTIKIKGSGYGAIDALYNSIVEKLEKEYCSLRSVKFEDFSMRVKLKHGRRWNRSDAPVEIKLVLRSKAKNNLYFSAESSSLMVAAVAVIRKAIVFLINSELAVKQLQKDIRSASERNRPDLVSKYTLQLSDMVHVANYEELF